VIVIEQFSKWIELFALPEKHSYSTRQAFLQQVLSKFGACAKCLTHKISYFKGEIQDFLDYALIDHWRTPRDHLQADGLAKQMVHTLPRKGLFTSCCNLDIPRITPRT
jgi:hypothetical protein